MAASKTSTVYLSDSWCDLKWSEWVPLQNTNDEFRQLPTTPGVYRVRPIDKDFLVYIGQTGRSLRQRMRELRVYTKSDSEMPFNDPHTAAPSLWAWKDAEGWEFECSVAPTEFEGLPGPESRPMREGFESYLLWKYRLERKESTNCNFGRFHPRYFKSSDRKAGRRGGRLPEGETNPSGGPSLQPLKLKNREYENRWMGIKWMNPIPLSRGCMDHFGDRPIPGLYKIMVGYDVVYIGQSQSLKPRIKSHVKKDWGEEPEISVFVADKNIRDYQLHEWENDLIGGFFCEHNRPPKYQFKNLK